MPAIIVFKSFAPNDDGPVCIDLECGVIAITSLFSADKWPPLRVKSESKSPNPRFNSELSSFYNISMNIKIINKYLELKNKFYKCNWILFQICWYSFNIY